MAGDTPQRMTASPSPSPHSAPARLGYLGPEGTFSEEAAIVYAPAAERIPYASFAIAVAAVREGAVDEALVPIENSLEGAVPATLDVLADMEGVYLCGELAFRVVLNLIAGVRIELAAIRHVVSHPQPLGQARGWITAHLGPNVEIVEAPSTAAAIRDLHQYGPLDSTAAIGPAAAAARYGRQIIARDIQPELGNVTRFVAVGHRRPLPTGRDKTTLVFAVRNIPGALVRALTVFSERSVNMTRIESRPSRRALGEYVFHVDVDGHQDDPQLAAALAVLARETRSVKILGSYPTHAGGAQGQPSK